MAKKLKQIYQIFPRTNFRNKCGYPWKDDVENQPALTFYTYIVKTNTVLLSSRKTKWPKVCWSVTGNSIIHGEVLLVSCRDLMPMFVHLLPSRQEYNHKLLCIAAANGLQIYLEGKVSEVKERVQAPYLVWTLPSGWLPHLWDFQLSHQIHLSPNESCPKVAHHCQVLSTSRVSQGLHTSNSFRQLYQISLLIDWHQIFGFKHGEASGRNPWGHNFIETFNHPRPADTSHSYPSPAPLLVLPQVFLQLHCPQGERSDPMKDKLKTTKSKSQHGWVV